MKNQQKKEERRENNSRKTKEIKETLKETAREINSVATNYGDTRNYGETRNSVATNYGDTRNSGETRNYGETNFVATNYEETNSKTTTDILTNTTLLSTDDTTTNDETRKMYVSPNKPLPSLPTDIYGFLTSTPTHTTYDTELTRKWHTYLKDNNLRKISKLVFRGIPLFLKYKTWSLFVNPHPIDTYPLLHTHPCGYEYQIHVDVQRTFRRHILFTDSYGIGQSRLFNILCAFATYTPQIGYCQGMSSFTSILLMYFPEKQAFEMLTSIISNNNLHSLFDKTLSKLNLILEIQIYIFKKNIPNIYKHMSYNKIEPSLYIYGWYLTLFTRFPIQLVLRIWDIFLFYGFPILLVSASSILKEHEILILESQEEQLIEVVNKIEGLSFNVERVIKNLKVFLKQLDMSEIRRKLG
ncbi:Rab-GTPase-TBC domain-containing protein [Hamiltosporidium magnivora]|uniref:Rab-GTPase-TBC domain-containing protein n=1 Tax=Hamiltosporidium magnivora TaxID=148818 RepID=A0A4Q9KYS1_9MICR|nr:Rab-GTPase-TBC domain-containing protein [Hamiltosporidium magnivora]